MKPVYLIMILLVMSTLFGCTSEKPKLSELQITACNSADSGGTCNTKLPDLNLVTQEQCCEVLGKCCREE